MATVDEVDDETFGPRQIMEDTDSLHIIPQHSFKNRNGHALAHNISYGLEIRALTAMDNQNLPPTGP